MKKNVFEIHSKLPEYWETSDGIKFFNEHDANNYGKTLKNKKVTHEERPAAMGKPKNSDASKGDKLNPMQEAKKRAEAIVKLDTIEAVEKALEGETAKSVIKAGKAKIEAIKASNEQIKNKETQA